MACAYLAALMSNGQILGDYSPLYPEDKRCIAVALAPEADSLDEKFHDEYVRKETAKLAESGISLSSHLIAESLDGVSCCKCADSSGYILYTEYMSLPNIPVNCLDCFDPVPLYKFPKLRNGTYYDLLVWEWNYIACDRLQMKCHVLEKSATRQLSDFNSRLSKDGRKLCKKLAKLTGKPFYYYLYQGQVTDLAPERKRRCPSCGKRWRLDEKLHSKFDFKCDRCRLLSNIGFDLNF